MAKTILKFAPWLLILVQAAIYYFGLWPGEIKSGDTFANHSAEVSINSSIETISIPNLCDEHGHYLNVFRELSFKDGPPIGYCWLQPDGKLITKVYDHLISVNTNIKFADSMGHLQSQTKMWLSLNEKAPIGTNGVADQWIGKSYSLGDVTESLNVLQYPKGRKLIEFKPQLFVTAGFSFTVAHDSTAVVGGLISTISAGKLLCHGALGPCNSRYKFLTGGVGYDIIGGKKAFHRINFELAPIMINVGTFNKYTTNLYFYPQIGWRDGHEAVGIGFALSL